MSYSFRIHFRIPEDSGIKFDEFSYEISSFQDVLPCKLHSLDINKKISDANELVIESNGYPKEEDARHAGEKVRNALLLTFTYLNHGIDLGFKERLTVITDYGLKWLESQAQQRVIQGGIGLITYETEPTPRFASMGVEVKISSPISKFLEVMDKALILSPDIAESRHISLQLYSSSFFEHSIEVRFLVLVMCIEVIIESQKKPTDVQQHIENLIEITKNAENIEKTQKCALIQGLKYLKNESIGQAGRRIIREHLANRKYNDMDAVKFFTHCYNLRSRLVHGSVPLPSADEIRSVILELQQLVAHLLVGDLFESNVPD